MSLFFNIQLLYHYTHCIWPIDKFSKFNCFIVKVINCLASSRPSFFWKLVLLLKIKVHKSWWLPLLTFSLHVSCLSSLHSVAFYWQWVEGGWMSPGSLWDTAVVNPCPVTLTVQPTIACFKGNTQTAYVCILWSHNPTPGTFLYPPPLC